MRAAKQTDSRETHGKTKPLHSSHSPATVNSHNHSKHTHSSFLALHCPVLLVLLLLLRSLALARSLSVTLYSRSQSPSSCIMSKTPKAIDISSLKGAQKTPRTAREVAEKKLRAELRAAGDTSGSKKVGEEREEDLAEYYRKRNQERLEQAKAAKQTLLLKNPTQR